ncbi:MAG TPA: 1,2-phenylacetyl-CoA epoxidase subunit PaaC [Acidimicrobiia bacterium]|nr:1,2-phenylacetyl-CoA epoxidase subunit PaaC [Acidimicrobiia bacterium]
MSEAVSSVPQGMPSVDLEPALRALVSHGDDNLVLAQRLGEWISNAPDLEIDIALGNIALDHLGVARALYTRAGEVEGAGRGEDDFAMRRTERDFLNVLLVEQPNGDFAHTVVRQFFFDVYQRLLWDELSGSDDATVAGVAARGRKESAYHHEFSSSWVVRLGDGTEESHARAQAAVDSLWRFTDELSDPYRDAWRSEVDLVFAQAGLGPPDDPYQRSGGRQGFHTEHLGFLLAEMQWMDRAYPGMTW